MFSVEAYDETIKCKTLEHSQNIFHDALADGERYYHVHNEKGIDYDILYKGNAEWFEDKIPAYIGKLTPEFLEYDENDESSIDIDFLNAYSQWICLNVSEYSIALAKVVLRYTENQVYFMDERIRWFLEPDERLHVGIMPEVTDTTIFLVGAFGNGFVKGDSGDENANKKSDILTFNSAFYLQNLLNGKKRSQVKYMQYPLENTAMGLGGLLIHTSCYEKFAKELGLEIAYNKEKIGKFKVSELKKYFKLDFRREDSTEENTVEVESNIFLYITWRFYNIPGYMSEEIINDKFREELKEYTDAVIGGKKALGILIRGTDYKSAGLTGSRKQATVEEMVPEIRRWMQEDGYERIVLATEDQEILNQMRKEFGKQVVAIAQERHTVNEFQKGQVIDELEKEIYSEEEYDNRVMETNINYFYALYMLAKCDGFMSSGQNNGWDTVNAMNAGRFERAYKFAVEKVEENDESI